MNCFSNGTFNSWSCENNWAPRLEIDDDKDEKNWSSEFVAAFVDWFDRFVKEDNIVSSVFKPVLHTRT